MMATPGPSAPTVNVGTFPTDGIDFSAIYTVNVNSVGGTGYAPEFPAPPFKVGTRAFGSNGTEYVFCQVGANSGGSTGNTAVGSTIQPWMALQIDPQGYWASPLTNTGFFNKWYFGINATGNTAVFTNTTTVTTYFWAAVRGSNLAVLTGANCTAFSHTYGQIAGAQTTATASAGRIYSLATPSFVVTGVTITQSIGNTTSTLFPGGITPVQLYASWPRLSVAGNTASGVYAE